MAETVRKVNISRLFARMAPLKAKAQKKGKDAQRAKAKLDAAWNRSQKKLRTSLRRNEATTGNPLQDEIIITWGVDKNLIKALLEFNKRFIGVKEIEVLIVYKYEVNMYRPMIPDGHTMMSHRQRCFLGVLSGERLSLRHAPDCGVSFIIPFTRYVQWGEDLGMVDEKDIKRYEGSLTVESHISEDMFDIWKVVSVLMGKEKNPLFFFGDEVVKSIPCQMMNIGEPHIWKRIKKLLHQASPEEKIKGADI